MLDRWKLYRLVWLCTEGLTKKGIRRYSVRGGQIKPSTGSAHHVVGLRDRVTIPGIICWALLRCISSPQSLKKFLIKKGYNDWYDFLLFPLVVAKIAEKAILDITKNHEDSHNSHYWLLVICDLLNSNINKTIPYFIYFRLYNFITCFWKWETRTAKVQPKTFAADAK